MNKKEILKALVEAETDLVDAQKKLVDAKKAWTDAETALINAKLNKEKLQEALRVNINTVPSETPEKDLRDLDIERFQEEHKELCEWARERDAKRGEE